MRLMVGRHVCVGLGVFYVWLTGPRVYDAGHEFLPFDRAAVVPFLVLSCRRESKGMFACTKECRVSERSVCPRCVTKESVIILR